LFGSRAKGNYKPGSDIDIALWGDELNAKDILSLHVSWNELELPYKLDLLNYTAIKEPALKEHIDRVGIELYKTWKEYRLGELGTVVTGKTPSHKFPEEFGNEMPFVTPTDYKYYNKWIEFSDRNLSKKGIEKLEGKILPPGSILVTCIGSDMGKVAINKVPVITNQQINAIIPNERIDSNFLYYKLTNSYELLRTYGNAGTAVPIVNKSDFENIEIEIPRNKREQTETAEILSSLDNKIDLLHRQNKTLEQLAETLFRQRFVESEELEIKNGTLGELIETTLGGEWGKENAEGSYIRQVCCIRGTDIADLQTGLAGRTPVRFVKEKKFEAIRPKDGDLILEISGGTDDQSTGRTTYINDLNRMLFPYPLIFSNFCRLIRPKKKEYTYFLYLYMQYLYKQDEFFNLENGSSGIKNLDYKFLLFELKYPLPNKKDKIVEFNEKISIFFEKINKNKHQIRSLILLRNTLLPKLISGEVKVKI
jgi:type I restriction enzyme S subunit